MKEIKAKISRKFSLKKSWCWTKEKTNENEDFPKDFMTKPESKGLKKSKIETNGTGNACLW